MVNWSVHPFVRLVIPLIFGIMVASHNVVPQLPILLVGIVSGAVAFSIAFLKMPKFKWVFGAAITIFLFCIGFARFHQHNELTNSNHFEQALEAQSSFIGIVSSLPEKGNWMKVKLSVEQISDVGNQWNPYSGNVLVYLATDTMSEALNYGDVLLVDAKITAVPSPTNPNIFDYQRYLHYQNIHHQAFARSHQWQQLQGNQGNWFWKNIYTLRKHLITVLQTHLKSEDAFAIGAALTLGYRAALSDEVETAYANAGAIHVLAVSGLHVGIIYFIINFLLQRLPYQKKWLNISLSLTSIWLFALLTGASPSVLRAATMFSFIAIGKHLERQNNIYNSLSAAAFFTLLFDPYLLMQVGFQLSYLAVLGIVFFQPKFYHLLYFKPKALDYLWQITTVSIGAQIAVFPISVYYFHQLPTYFWLSSLVVIPAAIVILSGGIVIFLIAAIPLLNSTLGVILNFFIEVVNTIVFAVQDLPFGIIDGLYIQQYDVLLLYGGIVAIMLIIIHKQFKYGLLLLAFLALFLMSRGILKTQQYFNQEVIIYDIAKTSSIDFIDGWKSYHLSDTSITQKNIDFVMEPHRLASGIKHVQSFKLGHSSSVEKDNWFYDFPFVQFYDKRFAFVNHADWQIPTQRIEVDYLVISNSPNLTIETLTQIFNFEKVIFDASNNWNATSKWEQQCINLGLSYFNVKKEGAWQLFLTN